MADEGSVSLTRYSTKFFGKYLSDDRINEICYNGGNLMWYEDVDGNWHSEETEFDVTRALSFGSSAASYKVGSVLDAREPILSAVLPTGERLQIVIPPATAEKSVSITIRKPSKVRYTLQNYIDYGALDEETADIFANAVKDGKNMVICGETGSGKTTFMKTLIDFIPLDDRIITIEDVPEIRFYEHSNVVSMFYPSEAKMGDPITSATLLKSCLRMKPDRILLAEVRGAETYDFLNVISSGHNGSMTSCHAGSVESCYNRLVMMSMQNDMARVIGKDMILDIVKNVIDLVVVFKKQHGKRRVIEYSFNREIKKL
ncbi:P-type DNA transfer ATPase VirB11 [Campylobacter fetus subsp. venerealis cfvi02/298]|nr:P-type DNA transfer ATPase VirB11 [Campylobacter fetus subsp. venerealis cfvi02/298]